MGRHKEEKTANDRLRRDRLNQLVAETGITKRDLAAIICVTPSQVSNLTAKDDSFSRLQVDQAERIIEHFKQSHGYRAEWLLGLDDDKNNAEHFASIVKQAQIEGAKLDAATILLAQLSGYAVTMPFEREDEKVFEVPFETILQCELTKGGQSARVSLDDWRGLANEICDFAEFKMQKVFANHAQQGERR